MPRGKGIEAFHWFVTRKRPSSAGWACGRCTFVIANFFPVGHDIIFDAIRRAEQRDWRLIIYFGYKHVVESVDLYPFRKHFTQFLIGVHAEFEAQLGKANF